MDAVIFVQNIKNLCAKKGIKPTNACKESGVGNSFINDIERGRTPSVAKVQLLANYLGVTTSELLGEKGNAEIMRFYHDVPPQGDLKELLSAGEFTTRTMFEDIKNYISTGNDSLISRLNSPTCSLLLDAKFYDSSVEQTEKPVILMNNGLTDGEQALLALFRQLTPEQQDMVIRMVQAAADRL